MHLAPGPSLIPLVSLRPWRKILSEPIAINTLCAHTGIMKNAIHHTRRYPTYASIAAIFFPFFELVLATSKSLARGTSDSGVERKISMWHGWPWYGLLEQDLAIDPVQYCHNSHSTVSSVSPPPGFWGLVDNNVFDDQLVKGKVLGIGVGLGILQQSEDEFDRLLRPSTCTPISFAYNPPASVPPLVVLNCLAWDARPIPPANRLKGMTCLWSWTSAR
jgi:hypothetical protein